jgi:hypothetical protein
MPYMEYMINKGYIEKHLCVQKDVPDNSCHGKCYLHKQIQKSQEEGKPEQNNNNRDKTQNNKLDDHIASREVPPPTVETFINLMQIADFPLIEPFADQIFVPPKA